MASCPVHAFVLRICSYLSRLKRKTKRTSNLFLARRFLCSTVHVPGVKTECGIGEGSKLKNPPNRGCKMPERTCKFQKLYHRVFQTLWCWIRVFFRMALQMKECFRNLGSPHEPGLSFASTFAWQSPTSTIWFSFVCKWTSYKTSTRSLLHQHLACDPEICPWTGLDLRVLRNTCLIDLSCKWILKDTCSSTASGSFVIWLWYCGNYG